MRPLRLTLLLAVLSLLALAPASALAGGGGGGGPCAGFASGDTLVMLDSCFSGVAHFAGASTTLTVRNDGAFPHSFTAVDGGFDTGVLEAGETATIKLGGAGIVEVYCVLHGRASGEGMAGILVVGEPAVQSAGPNTQGAALGLLGTLIGGAGVAMMFYRRRTGVTVKEPLAPPASELRKSGRARKRD
jgi:hypothetical protein